MIPEPKGKLDAVVTRILAVGHTVVGMLLW
jgi:hypothetical protein